MTRLPNASKLAGPDHLRALAITLVFFYHYSIFAHPDWIARVNSFGWTGVDLFFVLSGYLIAAPLFKQIDRHQPVSIKTFFIKRFFRILPAYFVVVGLYFLLPGFREKDALSPLWKFLTFTQNFGLDLHRYGAFSHAWSLCVEEQFYLLLPFLMVAGVALHWGKKSAFLIAALFGLGFLVRLVGWNHFVLPLTDSDGYGLSWLEWIYYPTYNRLDGLLAGVTIAGLCQFYPKAKTFIARYGNGLLALGLVLATAAWFICRVQSSLAASVFGFPLVAVAYGCLLAAAISPRCFLYRFPLRASSSIAALSYAIYLTHKGIIHMVQGQSERWGIARDSTLMFFICILACLLGAWLLRQVVEKPFMKWRDRVLKASAAD